MQDFKTIRAWHLARSISRDVFLVCDMRLFSKYPGLRSQTIRTANSISANISEGAAKSGPEFARYLEHAHAAANELENHLVLAFDVGLIPSHIFLRLCDRVDHVRRMLIRLMDRVRGEHGSAHRKSRKRRTT